MADRSGDIIVGGEAERSVAAPASIGGPLFHHSLLCQLGLPRRHRTERIFERRSGSASLLMTAGHWYTGLDWEPQPLPYGSRPRLVFVNIITEAVRTKSRTVQVEHSVRGFLRRLGIDCGGNSMKGFKRQMIALACCHMQLGFRTDLGVGQVDAKPISRFEAWVVDEEQQRGLWPGVLDLSGPFYDSALEHAVPLDPEALGALQNSAMALDVYSWLAHRLCRVTQPAGTFVSWRALKEQFGHEYRSLDEFRRSFLEAMGKAFSVYRDARIEIVRGGLRLLPSPPPIPKSMIVTPLLEASPRRAATATKEGGSATTITHAVEVRAEQTAAVMPALQPETIAALSILCRGWTIEELWACCPLRRRRGNEYDFDERFKAWAKNFVKSMTRDGETDAAAASGFEQDAPVHPKLKHETLEAVRAIAPGYSPAWLERTFWEWNRSKGGTLRHPDRAFLAWAKSFTKGRRP